MNIPSGFTISQIIAMWASREEWRPVEDWPYEISSFGRVRREGKSATLLPSISKGYPHVSLSRNGEVRTFRIHKLAAKAFLGEPPFSPAEVAHGDGDRANCRIDNIRWASVDDNRKDMVRHKTRVHGSAVFGSKLKEVDIPAIRQRLSVGERYPGIAADYDVSISTIYLIKHNKIWRRANGANWSRI